MLSACCTPSTSSYTSSGVHEGEESMELNVRGWGGRNMGSRGGEGGGRGQEEYLYTWKGWYVCFEEERTKYNG